MISKKSFLINRHLPREKVQLEAITVMTLPSHVFALVLTSHTDDALAGVRTWLPNRIRDAATVISSRRRVPTPDYPKYSRDTTAAISVVIPVSDVPRAGSRRTAHQRYGRQLGHSAVLPPSSTATLPHHGSPPVHSAVIHCVACWWLKLNHSAKVKISTPEFLQEIDFYLELLQWWTWMYLEESLFSD
jgi:hypothetical protein